MVAYEEYVALSRSPDSARRGMAAHFASSAFIAHEGPADEQAALFGAVMGFLDDPSVRVRAALAYGLLHAKKAPRPVVLALLQDAPIIARAVAQYSPVLLDADLLHALVDADEPMQLAMAKRARLSAPLVLALLSGGTRALRLAVLRRQDLDVSPEALVGLRDVAGDDPQLRGALLDRTELPAEMRVHLIDQVRTALADARLVKGAVAPKRLARILREARNGALVTIGEAEAEAGRAGFVEALIGSEHISARILLSALLNGRVQFFASAIGALAHMPGAKVASFLERGAPQVLRAAFLKCGLAPELADLLVRLVLLARHSQLADDLSARYFIVTVLIDELIAEYEGDIPAVLGESFAYLNEQCIVLGRKAARGVMAGFAQEAPSGAYLPLGQSEERALAAVA